MSATHISIQSRLNSALRRVGDRLLECRRDGLIDGFWSGSQFKAKADIIADEILQAELRQIVDIPIVSEEKPHSQMMVRPAEYWLIDPVDGTASFIGGFSGFVSQVALIRDEQPILAAIFAPALDKYYFAERGRGATINGERLGLRRRQVNLTLVDNYPSPRGVASRLFKDMNCEHYVESGSIGLKICLIAEDVANIFVKDVAVRDWDIGAPHLVLHEAGGVLSQFTGEPFMYCNGYEKNGLIVASSPSLLRELTHKILAYRHVS
jgi:3'(2'), 5'-bisphosphate nucleotidase